ncbi:hypothetical protein GRI99_04815 [Altererythrobacter buctensis]|uniref:Uncharacterized protein n=1 Tax=Alteraurantiacibacter buctensis TaxID=1503981 RepID=A0A844YVM0_9SPHN|nr:hypothetical protein [Alteraurantiacibacter buctensis]
MVVVDDALADPELVRAVAARHTYRPIGPHYPGLRAPVSAAIAMPLVDPLGPLLQQVFHLAAPPAFGECFLSLLTMSPQDLAPIQRLPHFDGVEPERLAVLLYLDPAAGTGTAFYRQRSTGFESVTAERFASYQQNLHADAARHGLPAAGYIGEDSALFERIGLVEGLFNRLVIYRGNQLHCASLPPDFVPVADPSRGRLTLNLFLNC